MKKFWYISFNSHGLNRFFYGEQEMVYCFEPIEKKWHLTSWRNKEIPQGKVFDSLELMYEHLLEQPDLSILRAFERFFI